MWTCAVYWCPQWPAPINQEEISHEVQAQWRCLISFALVFLYTNLSVNKSCDVAGFVKLLVYNTFYWLWQFLHTHIVDSELSNSLRISWGVCYTVCRRSDDPYIYLTSDWVVKYTYFMNDLLKRKCYHFEEIYIRAVINSVVKMTTSRAANGKHLVRD